MGLGRDEPLIVEFSVPSTASGPPVRPARVPPCPSAQVWMYIISYNEWLLTRSVLSAAVGTGDYPTTF